MILTVTGSLREKVTFIRALEASDADATDEEPSDDFTGRSSSFSLQLSDEDMAPLPLYNGVEKHRDDYYLDWKDEYIIATLLDPYNCSILSTTVSSATFGRYKLKLETYCNNFWRDKAPPVSQARRKKYSAPSMQSLVSDLQTSSVSEIENNTIDNNIDGYFTAVGKSNQSALEFWKYQKNRLPYLAPIAQNVLSIYLTSADAERLFSSSGRIVTKSRANLSDSTVRHMVLINNNSIKNLY